MSLRASESCLPKGGAAQLSFVPSPDGASSDRHSGQSHEFPPMPMGASTSETLTSLSLKQVWVLKESVACIISSDTGSI